MAFGQIGDRNEFSRSFSSGVLMDVFNYLTTLILLPLEILIDQCTTSSDIFHRKHSQEIPMIWIQSIFFQVEDTWHVPVVRSL